MLDDILIIVIWISIVLSFFIINVWRKKHFVKELYISEGVSIAFYIIIIAMTVGLLTIYFVSSKGLQYSWLYLLIVLLMDLVLLFVVCISSTTCIYLEEEMLIQKNIISFKKILIDNETKIIEKFDKRIIYSKESSISVSSRYLIGNINNLINEIRYIINKKTRQTGDGSVSSN